jgi:hypothetical protein
MSLPFTSQQFFAVFERYNTVIWPIQVIAYALGAGAVALSLFRPSTSLRAVSLSNGSRYADMTAAGILALMWLWIGIVYHFMYFSSINGLAPVFGLLFILEGLLLQWEGVLRKRLVFHARPNAAGVLGALLILYSMVIYPFIGHLAGHGYPRSPSFGVTPCPATIFTFGLLLWSGRRVPKRLLIVPALWAAVGTFAAIGLGVYEDLGLTAAALIAVPAIILKDRRTPPRWEETA